MVKNVSYAAPWFCMLETVAYFLQQLSRNQDVPPKILVVISDISRKLRYKPSVFPWNCFLSTFRWQGWNMFRSVCQYAISQYFVTRYIWWHMLMLTAYFLFSRISKIKPVFPVYQKKKKNQSFSSFSSSLYVCFGWHC